MPNACSSVGSPSPSSGNESGQSLLHTSCSLTGLIMSALLYYCQLYPALSKRFSQREKTGCKAKFCSFTLVQSILLVLGIPESALDSPAGSMISSTPASATADCSLDYLLPCSSKVPIQCLSKSHCFSTPVPLFPKEATINFLVVFQTQQIIKFPVLF